jgi:hypothetical protein
MGRVNIRPGVSILSVLRHLNYKPWYALAEFVDNSIQSFTSNRVALQRADGRASQLVVEIEFHPEDAGTIIVRDNAAGIAWSDFPRALRAAEIPPDRSGLSEFGMGMKSAACFLAKRWEVRTTALGEKIARAVSFDIHQIVSDQVEELEITTKPAAAKSHSTELVLRDIHRFPQGRTLGKIKEHLTSIYRLFLRDGRLVLKIDGKVWTFEEISVLEAPRHDKPKEAPVLWRKEIKFQITPRQRVSGFAALREKASTSNAGFALFRRDRLISGSNEDGYRPSEVFGRSNSYRYQRLFGELHLIGFDVTHTKDGFQWDGEEELFLEALASQLDDPPLRLLDQAEHYRVRPKVQDVAPAAAAALARTAEAIKGIGDLVGEQVTISDPSVPPQTLKKAHDVAGEREFRILFRNTHWTVKLEMTADDAVGDWLTVSEIAQGPGRDAKRSLGVRVSLSHPFMRRFMGADYGGLEPLLRVAAGLAVAQTTARASGVKYAGQVAQNLNELLEHLARD